MRGDWLLLGTDKMPMLWYIISTRQWCVAFAYAEEYSINCEMYVTFVYAVDYSFNCIKVCCICLCYIV